MMATLFWELTKGAVNTSPLGVGIGITFRVQLDGLAEVLDGDTIEVDIGGSSHTIRYISVDTPETKHPQKGWSVLDLKPLSSTNYW